MNVNDFTGKILNLEHSVLPMINKASKDFLCQWKRFWKTETIWKQTAVIFYSMQFDKDTELKHFHYKNLYKAAATRSILLLPLATQHFFLAVNCFTFVATYRFRFKSDFRQSYRFDHKQIVHKVENKLKELYEERFWSEFLSPVDLAICIDS